MSISKENRGAVQVQWNRTLAHLPKGSATGVRLLPEEVRQLSPIVLVSECTVYVLPLSSVQASVRCRPQEDTS